MKVGRINDLLCKDSYFGITPPALIPPLEPFELLIATLSNQEPYNMALVLSTSCLEPLRRQARLPFKPGTQIPRCQFWIELLLVEWYLPVTFRLTTWVRAK